MVIVNCGNNGDFEYFRDSYYWKLWIERNFHTDTFTITPHQAADKAIIIFEDPETELLFRLKAPHYIRYEDCIFS